ncbi:MAG: NTP transferase domain-containing protein [Candidatus Pacebacteria bacterium]|nr:NTP transferase domain-containing protein [Candidatus Paceibacterota bacterium]PIR63803.1 MAG: mannose-1-phosphate guanylyltransferase [Candidatus Pacebacteria bacterium CG10_big_fil_rev_8_21_14_0_10_40_26]PIZ78590.1 MAG: mannose-1-phosphate guanylyltransferase [Candidatus Pacebacteria bacterium CG_4_10_14_0_2_um_filter_40_20]PJA69441.1 MAG: mannose-1-phosphate guanylyltransferase [Candidatus Pacebacteria bacterium CG_4_9_14_3_um_filter_40_12]PJC41458.1 MAG: mannose-1-phosphate guanylyltrans
MSHLDHTYAVILAGGGGTRLWPKSRKQTPKQFLKLVGDETMIQIAANRITSLVPWDRVIVVTNALYKDEVHQLLPEVPVQNIIAEPAKRDTALAMLVGSLFAKSKDPDAVIINMASDHIVTNKAEFLRVMNAAAQVAYRKTDLVTVGISPTRPSTGFGYIKISHDIEKLAKGLSLFKVESFTEKPNEATARGFIATGKYFWNANMYVWSSEALSVAFRTHMPDLYEQTKHLESLDSDAVHKALPEIYEHADAISVDYAISEKADNLVLIPGDFGWDDVGDWKVVYDLEKKDLSGNVIISDHPENHTLAIASHNNLIHANGRLIAMVGIEDMVVIDTEEILMIIPKSQSQDVKKIVERLKEEKKDEYL